MVEKVIDDHIDVMEELNEDFLEENLMADLQMQELMDMQRALGYEVIEAP